jgi:hypothetical protein
MDAQPPYSLVHTVRGDPIAPVQLEFCKSDSIYITPNSKIIPPLTLPIYSFAGWYLYAVVCAASAHLLRSCCAPVCSITAFYPS